MPMFWGSFRLRMDSGSPEAIIFGVVILAFLGICFIYFVWKIYAIFFRRPKYDEPSPKKGSTNQG